MQLVFIELLDPCLLERLAIADIALARRLRKNLTFVAASSQSLEDVLAARWLSQFARVMTERWL